LCILNKEYQVSVEPGDILGLEIPPTEDDDFDIFFTMGGPTNYIFNTRLNSTIDLSENSETVAQLPQISFGLTSGTDRHCIHIIMSVLINCYHYPDQCTSGFPDVVSSVEGINLGDSNKTTTRLFPELKFGCSGKIVRFAVAVTVVNGNGGKNPKIQIWRPNDTEFYYKPGRDIPIVDSMDVCLRDRFGGQIFRCTLNDTYQVAVQPGDILGLEIPSEIDDDFNIIFTEQEPDNYMYVFEGNLTSPANLSEASTVTNHMPQINFTVMLGKKTHEITTIMDDIVRISCTIILSSRCYNIIIPTHAVWHAKYSIYSTCTRSHTPHTHTCTLVHTYVLKILLLQMEVMDQVLLPVTSLLCYLTLYPQLMLEKELFLRIP
jgi:hypothetical protein